MNAYSPSTYPSATEAITFALHCLEPFEVVAYLTDWTNGIDLTPWASAYMESQGLQLSTYLDNVKVRTTGRDYDELCTSDGKECAPGIP